MKNEKIGKIIFSKILQMPLNKYLTFIETYTDSLLPPRLRRGGLMPILQPQKSIITKPIYADLILKDGAITPKVLDERLLMKYSSNESDDRKVMFAIRWINMRNEFSNHLLQSLTTYQTDYLISGKEEKLKSLTLRELLLRFPYELLDQSRISRLVSNLFVKTPHNEIISLKYLFITKKRRHAHCIKQLIDESGNSLTDSEIQKLLHNKGIRLTVRTICNCRRLLNIPSYKERSAQYYGRDIALSDTMAISQRKFNKIPAEQGIYELSLGSKISYTINRSEVVYIGSSRNLRKRIASYSGKFVKNNRLVQLIKNCELFVRYFESEEYRALEKILLKNFKFNYGELPKANIIGGLL